MKKLLSGILAFTMVLTLFSACGSEENSPLPNTTAPAAETAAAAVTEESAVPAAAAPVTVSTIDELLAALGSDTVITLEAGTYDLTAAADYGQESKNPAYTWEPTYDGFELVLQNLKNLTVQGAGRESVNLLTVPRLSNVLVLSGCENVRLSAMTVGHTEGGEMCNGAVICLRDSDHMTLTDLGLYGCGTIGVDILGSDTVHVSGCDIYDCSHSGVRSMDSQDLVIEGTKIHDLKEEFYRPNSAANSAFYLVNTTGVDITDCIIADNLTMTLMDVDNVGELTLRNCTFENNRTIDGAFRFYYCSPVFDQVTFTDNAVRSWYLDQSEAAVDPSGNPIAEDTFAPAAKNAESEAADRKQVHAATVDEFLAAIASDTEIILDGELYDLSTAADYGKGKTDTYFWLEEFDGPELVITNVSNLSITSSDGDLKAHTVSATPRYADVLSFQHCSGIQVSGFTAGHTKEPGSCSGGVLHFEDCDGFTVKNCGLFGCGIIGVQAQYCSNASVMDCDIYECSLGGIEMRDVKGINIENCTFRDLGDEYGPGFEINLFNCEDAAVDGVPYEGGY